MGTRADFYLMENDNLSWQGSIAWDGQEIGNVAKAKTIKQYKQLLKEFFDNRDDVTYPEMGWPWPWENSKLTDECYIFIPNRLSRGKIWRAYEYEGEYEDHTTPLVFAPIDQQPKYDEDNNCYDKPKKQLKINVPDMTEIQNVSYGKRSGVIFIQV